MSKLRKFMSRRIGRRNLPFVGAVAALIVIVIVLIAMSPKPYSDRAAETPSAAASE
ncbi:MAG: hypothetical protein JWO25_1547 [Alphaproteobacteria bacterium]|nr:hypothetical protein [Alphaproteobacteria bacterium]